MRVTFVLPPVNWSGGIRVAAIYAQRLSQRGHEVLVVSPPPPRVPRRRALRMVFTGQGWPRWERLAPSHLDGTEVRHKVLDRYRPVVDADVPDADVVIATWWETAEWVAALSPAKGAKVYFVQHDETQLHGQPVNRVQATYRLPLAKVTIAPWLAELMATEYGDTDVAVVPNSVDAEQFHSPPRGKQQVPTVGFMLSRERWKGSDVALEAIAALRRTWPELRVKAFGELEDPSGEYDLGPNAYYRVRPGQAEMNAIYGGCDAWLFASRSEGFGLPILEAMACRTPVIATPAGAAPALVSSGGGLLVPMEDAEAMAQAATTILTLDDDAWRARSASAHAIATGYTWNDAADRFEAFLTRTTQASAPPWSPPLM